MRKSIQWVFLAYLAITLVLSGCTSVSTPASPTQMPTATVVPANTDLITASDFQFQISEATLDDTVKMIGPSTSRPTEGYLIVAQKRGLAFTPSGSVPANATGDMVLILHIKLHSGDFQEFLAFEPKIIEEGVEKSAVEVFTDEVLDEFYWIYDVKKSSDFSFLLKFPDETLLDLQTMLRHADALKIQNP